MHFRSLNHKNINEILIFLLPCFFLSVRRWSNGIALLMLIISLFFIAKSCKDYFKNRDGNFWILLIVLVIPFFAECLIQALRWRLDGPNLDASSRFFYAAIFFVYVSKHNSKGLMRAFSAGALVGLVSVILVGLVFPVSVEVYEGRFATYFVDPLTLSIFSVALLTAALHVDQWSGERFPTQIIKLAILALVFWIVLTTQSRAGWLSFTIVGCLVMASSILTKRSKIFLLIAFLFGVLFLLNSSDTFHVSEIFKNRLLAVWHEMIMWLSGDLTETSIGARLTILKINIELLKIHPFIGVQDGEVPADIIRSTLSWVPDYYLRVYELAGSHSEVFAQLLRKGIPLGMLTLFSLFIFPAIYFARLFLCRRGGERVFAMIPLFFVLSIFIGGLFLETLNLKMTATFYAFALSIFYAANGDGQAHKLISKFKSPQ